MRDRYCRKEVHDAVHEIEKELRVIRATPTLVQQPIESSEGFSLTREQVQLYMDYQMQPKVRNT